MVLLSLFCVSAFTLSTSSGAPVVDNCNAYTKESPTQSIGGFELKESNRIPGVVGKKGRTPRILHGEEAKVGEFPWMASIHWNNDGHQCGGSIISPKHILTAGHCIPKNESTQLTVLVGGHFRDESLEPRAQRITVKRAIQYPCFNLFSLKHDIGILVLEKAIKLNNYTAIINLPSEEHLYGDVNAVAAGWGKTYGDWPFLINEDRSTAAPRTVDQYKYEVSPMLKTTKLTYYAGDPTNAAPLSVNSGFQEVSPVLKVTNLTIFNNTECSLWHNKTVNYKLDNYTMCAGASFKSLTGDLLPGDTTQGDSGGPLVITENGKWVVVGITSSTHSSADHPLPGIYTRVSAYLDWIKEQMSQI